MHGRYGALWLDRWRTGDTDQDGVDRGIANAMAVWGEELAGFADRPDCIAYALSAYVADFPPTLPQFLELCRTHARRVSADSLKLAHKQTDEEREQAKRAAEKIAGAFAKPQGFDPLLWAKPPASQIAVDAIVTEAKNGNRVLSEILADLVDRGIVTAAGKLAKPGAQARARTAQNAHGEAQNDSG